MKIAAVVQIRMTVLEHHQRGGFAAIVLRGDIDVVAPNGSLEDLAVFPDMLGDFALGDALLAHGIGPVWVAHFDRRLLAECGGCEQ